MRWWTGINKFIKAIMAFFFICQISHCPSKVLSPFRSLCIMILIIYIFWYFSQKKRPYRAQEIKVQELISEIGIWSEFIENFFPIVFSLFLGNWTDVYGIKAPFLFAIAGVVIRYAGLLLCTHYKTWTAQVIILFSVLPSSLTGGRIAISMLVYSFVAVSSSIADRTFRVGVLTAVRTFGRSAGSALGGYLKRNGKDHYFIFGFGGGIAAVSFIYILLFMPNPRKGSNTAGFKMTRMHALRNIFNFKNIIESAKAFFRKREYGVREQLYLLVIVLIFTMAPMQGYQFSFSLCGSKK